MNVWGYWKCPYCGNVIRADNRTCPSCGTPVQSDTKFFINKNEAIEYVPPEKESRKPNWICEYCNSQNPDELGECKYCGSLRHEAKRNYFGKIKRPEYESDALFEPDTDDDSEDETDFSENIMQNQYDFAASVRTNVFKSFFSKYGKLTAVSIAIFLAVISLIWLFTPITRTSEIQSFIWHRSIAIEQYQKCRESDWTLPAEAELAYTRNEIHHYDSVFDHYETKYRDVPHQVPDGYDIDYKDLGNGQFDEVKTPRYKTVYEREPYTEAVYRDEPVYRLKYYYDIGRWKKISSVNTSGVTQEPYWGSCEYPSNINSPQYGDYRQGSRKEEYYAVIYDDNGRSQQVSYSQNEWLELQVGDKISYKTFRFSDKPL